MESLDTLLATSRKTVETSTDGELPLGLREAMWAQLGPRGEQNGWRRRASLALACAKKAESRDTEVVAVLADVERRLAQVPDPYAAAAADRAMDRWLSMHGSSPSFFALAAATKALAVIAYDEFFHEDYLDPLREVDEPASGDAAFFAASSLAGGYPFTAGSDTAARRKFWLWWLDTAKTLADADE